MKSNYKVGQPVIAYDDPDNEKMPVLGYILSVAVNNGPYYVIEWCDNEQDLYPQYRVEEYVKTYNKYLKEVRS